MSTHHLGLLRVSGIDAGKLLQGQLTCDINSLTDGEYCLAALCNPQGRVISLFYVINLPIGYYLVMPHDMISVTLAALKKYAVFYKVALDDATPELTKVVASINNPLLFDINTGVPRLYPETSAMFLPHEINLDKLGAISFDKGCYTGQEIIARMHYRAKLKKRMYSTTLPSTELLTPGSEHDIGTIVDISSQGDHCVVLYIAPTNEADS